MSFFNLYKEKDRKNEECTRIYTFFLQQIVNWKCTIIYQKKHIYIYIYIYIDFDIENIVCIR